MIIISIITYLSDNNITYDTISVIIYIGCHSGQKANMWYIYSRYTSSSTYFSSCPIIIQKHVLYMYNYKLGDCADQVGLYTMVNNLL